MTFFRTKRREIGISFRNYLYTPNTFAKLIADWDDKLRVRALEAVEIAKDRVDLSCVACLCCSCKEKYDSELIDKYRATHCL